jgi:hypothetical protein
MRTLIRIAGAIINSQTRYPSKQAPQAIVLVLVFQIPAVSHRLPNVHRFSNVAMSNECSLDTLK